MEETYAASSARSSRDEPPCPKTPSPGNWVRPPCKTFKASYFGTILEAAAEAGLTCQGCKKKLPSDSSGVTNSR